MARCDHYKWQIESAERFSKSQSLSSDEWSHQEESACHEFKKDEEPVSNWFRFLSKDMDHTSPAIKAQDRHIKREGTQQKPDHDCQTKWSMSRQRHLLYQWFWETERATEFGQRVQKECATWETAKLASCCLEICTKSLPTRWPKIWLTSLCGCYIMLTFDYLLASRGYSKVCNSTIFSEGR